MNCNDVHAVISTKFPVGAFRALYKGDAVTDTDFLELSELEWPAQPYEPTATRLA